MRHRQTATTTTRAARPVDGGLWLALLCLPLLACGRDKAPVPPSAPTVPAPSPAGPSVAPAQPVTPAAPLAPPPAPPPAPAPPAEVDPSANAWNLAPRGADVAVGGRAYVLTRGRDRSHTDPGAVYHLYAHDVAEVRGNVVSVRELGGETFEVGGLFVIPAGLADKAQVKKGDMVLAEWASSLKHAVITGLQKDKVTIRYTDLPANWADDKLAATKDRRHVTLQQEGLHPGNFAVADLDGRKHLVMLISQSGDRFLVHRFAGRVTAVPTTALAPIPLCPSLKRRQKVLAPWVGIMYPGRVREVSGVKVTVAIDEIGRKEPVVVSLGQVVPL